MAITTLAGAIAGLLPPIQIAMKAITPSGNNVYSFWAAIGGGFPPTAAAPAAGLSGEALVGPVVGSIPFADPTTAETVVARWSSSFGGSSSHVLLIDRLWQNSGLSTTSTASQTVNSVAWPARDLDQASDGRGVFIALEVQSSTGSGAPVATLTYTNSAGTAGRTATTVKVLAATQATGQIFIFALQSGDVGVQSVQSYQQSVSWTTGTISLIAFRLVAMAPGSSGTTQAQSFIDRVDDVVTLAAPRVWAESVLQLVVGSTGAASLANFGSITFAQG